MKQKSAPVLSPNPALSLYAKQREVDKIKAAMNELNWSYRKLARESGANLHTVLKMHCGRRITVATAGRFFITLAAALYEKDGQGYLVPSMGIIGGTRVASFCLWPSFPVYHIDGEGA